MVNVWSLPSGEPGNPSVRARGSGPARSGRRAPREGGTTMKGVRQLLAMASIGLVSAAIAVALVQPATGAAGDPKVWGVGTTKSLDDFTFSSFHTVLKKQVNTPGGYLSINSMIGIEDDCSDSEASNAQMRLRVDGKNVWKTEWAFEMDSDCNAPVPEYGTLGAPAVASSAVAPSTLASCRFASSAFAARAFTAPAALVATSAAAWLAARPWGGSTMKSASSRGRWWKAGKRCTMPLPATPRCWTT